MSSPTSRHHIDTKRLLYPLIGMRNAKHFERLHKRASTMKKISTPKHLRATLTSHLEHNEHGLDAKKVFFDTVRKRLNGVKKKLTSYLLLFSSKILDLNFSPFNPCSYFFNCISKNSFRAFKSGI